MKKLGLFIVAVAFSSALFAQTSEYPDSPYDKPHMNDRKPIAMQQIRYADVMWSKQIERTLPLREKMNHPLYFPNNETGRIGSRFSLSALTVDAVEKGMLFAYDPMSDGAVPITFEDFKTKLGASIDTIYIEQEDGTEIAKAIENQMNPSSIKFLILREEWVFDKQRSVMDPRIMWITALREFEKDGEIRKSLPYKIYYPAAQPILARNEVFNPNSDGDQKSFYDTFQKRHFSSFISRETNVYNDREVSSYKFGIEQLYEAERIKTFIFNFEHDLWEY
ncbi:MAG: gliding motility protein GldN [Bacteroidales bacterium]|nr:gliding motility protein GldN [Bacteroidales bacterium]MBR4349301.1 gliding motility protein GldN [Bacteroidales bacterium]